MFSQYSHNISILKNVPCCIQLITQRIIVSLIQLVNYPIHKKLGKLNLPFEEVVSTRNGVNLIQPIMDFLTMKMIIIYPASEHPLLGQAVNLMDRGG